MRPQFCYFTLFDVKTKLTTRALYYILPFALIFNFYFFTICQLVLNKEAYITPDKCCTFGKYSSDINTSVSTNIFSSTNMQRKTKTKRKQKKRFNPVLKPWYGCMGAHGNSLGYLIKIVCGIPNSTRYPPVMVKGVRSLAHNQLASRKSCVRRWKSS